MRAMIGCTAALLALSFSLSADDKKDEKIDGKKLMGKWELKDPPKGGGEVIEFTKEGKFEIAAKGGKKDDPIKGTYKIDGKKLTLNIILGKEEIKDESTVYKLTDTEFVFAMEDSKTPKTYTRVK